MRVFTYFIVLLCVVLPFLITFINHHLLHKKFGNLALWLVACVLCWLLIQGSVQLIEWTLQMQLDSFDLNHDGIFSPDEITPQQEQAFNQAFNNVVSDTGRALAPITGAIDSIFYNSIVFGLLAFFKYNKKMSD